MQLSREHLNVYHFLNRDIHIENNTNINVYYTDIHVTVRKYFVLSHLSHEKSIFLTKSTNLLL